MIVGKPLKNGRAGTIVGECDGAGGSARGCRERSEEQDVDDHGVSVRGVRWDMNKQERRVGGKDGSDRGGGVRAAKSPDEAVELLCSRVRRVGTEDVPLSEARGRVLGEYIRADRPSPAVDVSAMDGFAVRAAEVGESAMAIVGEVRIGRDPGELPGGAGGVGGAVRIVTGGALPRGADAVVKVEDVGVCDGGKGVVVSAKGRAELRPGLNVRRCGENAEAGAVVLKPGCAVTPARLTAMASFGVAKPAVFQLVRVAVISTGDEVVSVEKEPTAWQLRDGNGPAIVGMLGSSAWVEVVGSERVKDDAEEMRRAIQRALKLSDAVVLSGGVSMGHRDFVPTCVRECGGEALFHKIPQRPGRPMLGAVGPDGHAIMALPGNPVSVLVTARRVVLPVLAWMGGLRQGFATPRVRLASSSVQTGPPDLYWQRLVRLNAAGEAEALDGRGSGDVAWAAQSDGFVEVSPGSGDAEGPWPYYPWVWCG